jgi:hypothetical protein
MSIYSSMYRWNPFIHHDVRRYVNTNDVLRVSRWIVPYFYQSGLHKIYIFSRTLVRVCIPALLNTLLCALVMFNGEHLSATKSNNKRYNINFIMTTTTITVKHPTHTVGDGADGGWIYRLRCAWSQISDFIYQYVKRYKR